jgi:hypothetical protein
MFEISFRVCCDCCITDCVLPTGRTRNRNRKGGYEESNNNCGVVCTPTRHPLVNIKSLVGSDRHKGG